MIPWIMSAIAPIAFSASDPWADVVVSHSAEMSGSGIYNHATSVLGTPSSIVFDPVFGVQRPVTLISPAYYLTAVNRAPTVLTVPSGQFVKVRFDEPVEDHPRNPFGIDLIVFGNAFFLGFEFANPNSDFESYFLTGAVFDEPITVAVSQSGEGDPLSHPGEWYVFEPGPIADGMFPTHAIRWDRVNRELREQSAFDVPVDPQLAMEDFGGLSAADAGDRYLCSGGGTGFDLVGTGFAWIQYVYMTGEGGEVDALADVFPVLGDFDRDGDVDLRDMAELQSCFGVVYLDAASCACRPGDVNGDATVGPADYPDFSAYLDGPR